MKDFYDMRVHLSKLLIVANALNDKFHDIMRNDILRKDFACMYQAGPLKAIERCQSKTENDYFMKQYPQSSQVTSHSLLFVFSFEF